MAAEQRLTPVERGNLVAYLDGELDPIETEAIPAKLSASPTARREVEALERAWGLLDRLDRPQASDDLAERTLTALQRQSDRGGEIESAVKHADARAMRAGLWAAAALVAVGIGYSASRWAWPVRSDRLTRELSLAEHLDEYRAVTTFDFLNELANSSAFGSDQDD